MICFNKKFNHVIIFTVMMIVLFSSVKAKTNAWSTIPQESYIEKLVTCQKIIKEQQWQYTIWPKQNKRPKPSYSKRLDRDKIYDQVIKTLKMESILYDKYNFQLSHEKLQSELDKAVRNSKLPRRLLQLFSRLDNDADSIVECVIRPVLIRNEFIKAFKGQNNELVDKPLKGLSLSINAESFSLPAMINKSNLNESNLFNMTNTWQDISTSSAPVARKNHTAVWTGSKMIIWGGLIGNNSGFQNTGGKYDPATDMWEATSLTMAPSARISHTAIWTGDVMVVWGGSDNIVAFNSGGRYDPDDNSWLPTNNTNSPIPRSLHSAVWTGTEMIIWGGFGGGHLNNGGIYDPLVNTWSSIVIPTSSAPAGRAEHTAVWTGSHMVVSGGYGLGSIDVNTGGIYDFANNSWTATSTTGFVPSPRDRHTAEWTGDAMIIWGGTNGGNTGGILDPINNNWVATAVLDAPTTRQWHSSIWTGNQMILWGGNGSSSTDTGARFDIANNTWQNTTITGAPSARDRHTAVWTNSAMIIWGGTGSLGNTNTGAMYFPDDVPRTISGNVTGLHANNPMLLQNNSNDFLLVTSDGFFEFDTALFDSQGYDVSILYAPVDPIQACEVINGFGVINNSNIDNVEINCTFGNDLIFKNGLEN